jgi:hypothetical protein
MVGQVVEESCCQFQHQPMAETRDAVDADCVDGAVVLVILWAMTWQVHHVVAAVVVVVLRLVGGQILRQEQREVAAS